VVDWFIKQKGNKMTYYNANPENNTINVLPENSHGCIICGKKHNKIEAYNCLLRYNKNKLSASYEKVEKTKNEIDSLEKEFADLFY
jgi:hypothetical protein